MDIKSLLDVLCRVVADMIKGRDPQDIRRVFHAPDPSSTWAQSNMTPSLSTEGEGDRESRHSRTSWTLDSAQYEHAEL